MRQRQPDYRTIAAFRHDFPGAIVAASAAFVQFCREQKHLRATRDHAELRSPRFASAALSSCRGLLPVLAQSDPQPAVASAGDRCGGRLA